MTERIMVNARDEDKQPHRPRWMDEEPLTYAKAGVDIAEGARAVQAIKEVVRSTYRPEVIGDIGGFGGLFSLARAKDMDDPVLVGATDGVGTKIEVAQLAGKHTTVGIDLVAMCANDILATGAEPLFFLDYMAQGVLKAEKARDIISGIAEGCKQAGCALIGGEMAEHPGVMGDDDYDLSGCCVGLVDRAFMLDPASVQAGDVLIGLASSGLHSNGYSLARAACLDGITHYELRIKRKELGDLSLEAALLEPTRMYVKPLQKVFIAHPQAVRSLAHITGGGITENVNRALPAGLDALITLGLWPVPPVISYVCEAAHLPADQALKTFNMGLGMVLIVDPTTVVEVMSTLRDLGQDAYRIGTVVAGTCDACVHYEHEEKLYGFEG